ncbi:hypothetical protein Y032_0010g1077 [Ancylostoma ceylanicum]|uniref:Uncharacterized protein n=1 Tax=Ancylostoma ceylanicum TaxID=53326 RepID=A0A016VFV7_9BILA|nr:hypothetical protein Y032_0010g1077 [Ancylostoma ceylanicum]
MSVQSDTMDLYESGLQGSGMAGKEFLFPENFQAILLMNPSDEFTVNVDSIRQMLLISGSRQTTLSELICDRRKV